MLTLELSSAERGWIEQEEACPEQQDREATKAMEMHENYVQEQPTFALLHKTPPTVSETLQSSASSASDCNDVESGDLEQPLKDTTKAEF
jgi:hypothetical protein